MHIHYWLGEMIAKMIVKMAAILICAIVLFLPYHCFGSFTWNITDKDIMFDDSGKVIMIWDYTTDEQILSIEWLKQPGNILLARMFGSSEFIVSKSYTGRVLRYNATRFSAAIEMLYFLDSDNGVYSCNITTSHKYSRDLNVTKTTRKPLSPEAHTVKCTGKYDADISFYASYNGGSSQKFYVEIRKEKDAYFRIVDGSLLEVTGTMHYSKKIDDLDAGTLYFFRIMAQNKAGKTYSDNVVQCTTESEIDYHPVSPAAVAGGLVVGVVVLIAAVLAIVLYRRRFSGGNTQQTNNNISVSVAVSRQQQPVVPKQNNNDDTGLKSISAAGSRHQQPGVHKQSNTNESGRPPKIPGNRESSKRTTEETGQRQQRQSLPKDFKNRRFNETI